MKIKEILIAANGKLIIGNENNKVKNFCKDTRILQNGDTYIGIKGEKFDGNKFWEQAFEAGAETIIIQDIDFSKISLEKWKDRNIITVNDTIQALADIATYIRNQLPQNFQMVGVTGSVGKTSTKDIIANVISQKYKTLKTQGNNNNNIGLPFTMFKLEDQEVAVIEMGMNHFGEIRKLTKIAKPTISVITNIGTSHIGNLGSRENILKAKLEILEGMDKKILVLNNDNDLLHKYYLENMENKDIKIYTFGIENKSDVMAEKISSSENSSDFICNINGEKFKIKIPVGGEHFVYNALCAATVGKLLNLSNGEISKGIETFKLTAKRMDITKLENGITIINDSYNASFESMQASLKYLKEAHAKRKIAVLGDMLELGKYTKELHEKVGKEVKKQNIDILICSGENAKYIEEEAKRAGMLPNKIFYFDSNDKVEKFIKENWQVGDCILLKASNGMKFFEIANDLTKNNV